MCLVCSIYVHIRYAWVVYFVCVFRDLLRLYLRLLCLGYPLYLDLPSMVYSICGSYLYLIYFVYILCDLSVICAFSTPSVFTFAIPILDYVLLHLHLYLLCLNLFLIFLLCYVSTIGLFFDFYVVSLN